MKPLPRHLWLAIPGVVVIAGAIIWIFAGILGGASGTPPAYLSDQRPASATQGWGTLQYDRSVDGNPIWIGSMRFLKGLGTHAPARLCWDLGGKFRTFAASAGRDAEVTECGGALRFLVTGDGRTLWEAPVPAGMHEPVEARADVRGVRELCLLVEDGGDGNRCDHADWGSPRVIP